MIQISRVRILYVRLTNGEGRACTNNIPKKKTKQTNKKNVKDVTT